MHTHARVTSTAATISTIWKAIAGSRVPDLALFLQTKKQIFYRKQQRWIGGTEHPDLCPFLVLPPASVCDCGATRDLSIHAGSLKAKLHSTLNVCIMDDCPWVPSLQSCCVAYNIRNIFQGLPLRKKRKHIHTQSHPHTYPLLLPAFSRYV